MYLVMDLECQDVWTGYAWSDEFSRAARFATLSAAEAATAHMICDFCIVRQTGPRSVEIIRSVRR